MGSVSWPGPASCLRSASPRGALGPGTRGWPFRPGLLRESKALWCGATGGCFPRACKVGVGVGSACLGLAYLGLCLWSLCATCPWELFEHLLPAWHAFPGTPGCSLKRAVWPSGAARWGWSLWLEPESLFRSVPQFREAWPALCLLGEACVCPRPSPALDPRVLSGESTGLTRPEELPTSRAGRASCHLFFWFSKSSLSPGLALDEIISKICS